MRVQDEARVSKLRVYCRRWLVVAKPVVLSIESMGEIVPSPDTTDISFLYQGAKNGSCRLSDMLTDRLPRHRISIAGAAQAVSAAQGPQRL